MLLIPFSVLLLSTGVIAMWPLSSVIGETCFTTSTLSFDNCTSADVSCLCSNIKFLATVACCITDNSANSVTRDKAWDHVMSANCKEHIREIADKKYNDATIYLEHSNVLPGPSAPPDEHSWGGGPVYTTPLTTDENLYQESAASVRNFLHQKDISEWQGDTLVSFWMLIMVLFGLGRFFRYMAVRFTGQYSSMRRPTRFKIFLQKHITIPALFGYKHMTKIRFLGIAMSLPTRMESIFIAIYFILNVIFDIFPYTFIANDTMYPTHYKEMLRYVSDRSGIIGVIQLPLLTLFALRNNILIWMTGWSYSTFNTYHRAITRIVYAQFIVHSVTKHIFSGSYGGSMVKYFYPLPYYRWGVAGMFIMAIMITSASFRMNHYGFFFRLHIISAIASYVCIIYHMKGLGYRQTLYVAFGIWGADWIIRLIRIIFLNFAIFMTSVAKKKTSFAELCTLSGDIVNVRVRATVVWKPKPGEYVFIYVNRKIWEAHPFSVVGPSSDGESFQLLCKARSGMTKRFNKYLKDKGCDKDHPLIKPVLIEGPYGLHCPVERYSEVLLIAGGVGITGVIPYVEYLTHSVDANPSRILFIWAVQARSDTRWIEDRLLRLSNKVEIVVYSATPATATSQEELKGFAYESTPDKEYFNSPNDETEHEGDNIFNLVHESDDNISTISSRSHDDDRSRRPPDPYNTQLGRSLTFKPSSQRTHSNETSPSSRSGFEKLTSQPRNHGPSYPSMLSLNSDSTQGKGTQPPYRRRLSRLEWYQQIKDKRADLPAIIKEFFIASNSSACVLGCGPPPMMDTMRQSVARYLDLNEHGRVDYFEEAYSW